MKYIIASIACLVSCISLAEADESPYKSSDIIIGNSRLSTAKMFPQEMADLSNQIASNNYKTAVDIALRIVDKSKAAIGGKRYRPFEYHEETQAYRFAWVDILRLLSVVNDRESEELIMRRWNDGLTDSPEVPEQIRALNYVHANPFFNDRFWSLYSTTKDADVIGRMGYVIARQGTSSDIAHVKARWDVESDPRIKERLSSTLNWYDWVQRGGDHGGGTEPAVVLSP